MAVALSQTDQLQVSWIPCQTLSIDIFISAFIITSGLSLHPAPFISSLLIEILQINGTDV